MSVKNRMKQLDIKQVDMIFALQKRGIVCQIGLLQVEHLK